MRTTCHASFGRSVWRSAIGTFSLTSQSVARKSQRRGKAPRAIPVNTKSRFNSIRRINFEDSAFPITSASTTLFNERLFVLADGAGTKVFAAARKSPVTFLLYDGGPAHSGSFRFHPPPRAL